MRSLIRMYRASPAMRFLMVGGTNFALVYAVYLAALTFVDFRWAYWISLAVGLLFVSVLNIRHTFERHVSLPAILVYGAYYLGYSWLHVFSIGILIETYSVWAEIAPLITLAALTPPHFVVSRALIQRVSQVRGAF